MTINEKTFEEMKEFLDSLYEPKFIKVKLKKDGDQFIQDVLSIVKDEDAKRDITMLYEYYVENGSELVVKSINDYAHCHKIHDALEIYPLTDDELTGVIDQAVSDMLFYNRKGDEEINQERMDNYFKTVPNAVDVMVEKFRQSLKESVKNED
jgi:hypothetical protein